jgi:hypothetical protein
VSAIQEPTVHVNANGVNTWEYLRNVFQSDRLDSTRAKFKSVQCDYPDGESSRDWPSGPSHSMLCRRCAISLLSRGRPQLSIAARQRLLKLDSPRHHQIGPFSTSTIHYRPNAHEERQDFCISEEEESTSTVIEKTRKDTFASEPSLDSSKTSAKRTNISSLSTSQFTDFYLPEEQDDPEPLPSSRTNEEPSYHIPTPRTQPKLSTIYVPADEEPTLTEFDPDELAPQDSQPDSTHKDFFIPLQHPTALPPPDIFPLPTPEQAAASGRFWWVPPPQEPYHNKANKHFEFSDQRIPGRKKVLSTYTTNLETAERLLAQLEGRVYGMDLEWLPNTGNRVDVVQICDERQILIMHVCHMSRRPLSFRGPGI